METEARNPIQKLQNGDGTEENNSSVLLFPSPFLYRVCIEFRAAVSVSASVWISSSESVRPKNWCGLDLSRCQIASAIFLLYRTMHCTTFHRLERLSSHRVNRGTLCGYYFPQLIKTCLARIPLPRCLDPSRHVTLPPDGTVYQESLGIYMFFFR